MAPRARNIGRETLGLVEVAPLASIRQLLAYRETETETVLDDALPLKEGQDADTMRKELIAVLDGQSAENLLPLEDRCCRIARLARGKGPASLDMLVGQRLTHQDVLTYDAQPDALCRAIWVFLTHQPVFEDAEAFHAARQYRDFGQMYDAFEVDVEEPTALDAASVDEDALAARITTLLELPTRCTVRTVNLPKTGSHPAAVMLIVRHPGPLSSVFSHKDNGLKGTIYYRPPNEATLIWTPKTRQMEICAQSPAVRQKVGAGFAEVVLQHDVSRKPLTWRRYDLSRFRRSLSLPILQREDCEILAAQLVEIELRLGSWSRRLALKVAIEDDIEQIAGRYLGASDLFRRAEGFSRVIIAVRYLRGNFPKERSLNMSIGYNRSNLQSNRDPEERAMGYELLDHWGILNAFRQLDDAEAGSILPQLLELHDLTEDDVSGGFLRDRGLDPQRLIKAGLIEQRGRQNRILIDEDDDFGEVTLGPSGSADTVAATGLHGEDLGSRPLDDLLRYALKRDWLDESLLKLIKPAVSRPVLTRLDNDLVCLGVMKLEGKEVPVYLARRLTQPETIRRLDLILRGRQEMGVGIVMAAGPSSFNHLGPNVVVRLNDHLSADGNEVLSSDSLEQAFRAGQSMALGGASIVLMKSGSQSAMLHIHGKPPLAIHGGHQIRIFERLIAAHQNGSPEIKAAQLLEGSSARSPGDAFHPKSRASVIGVYLQQGSRKGYWRLVV